MDCGYDGAAKFGRFLTPKKRSSCRDLDADDVRKNGKIEKDRVIVENYFGRMKCLWGMAKRTFCLKDDLYCGFFCMFVAMTNYHVLLFPLRSEDGDVEKNYTKRLLDRHNRKESRRRAKLNKQKKLRRARRAVSAEEVGGDEMEVQEASSMGSHE